MQRRELWAVVKSDAWGLGLLPVARTCLDAGARRLCIMDIAEARLLR
ncbi:MAG: alanine racemase [Candidatus Eremiobacteraeota bacterium]|nr:alanine racemase [Candidatus Eremiobacteraeota bacterium]MBC5826796.1 alanine racemase [Candidatus Eremiobacteraeota bacterium]